MWSAVKDFFKEIRDRIEYWQLKREEKRKLMEPDRVSEITEATRENAFFKLATDKDIQQLLGYLTEKYEEQILKMTDPVYRDGNREHLDKMYAKLELVKFLAGYGERLRRVEERMEAWKNKQENKSDF